MVNVPELPDTEMRLESSNQLHKMDIAEIVSLMIEEEYHVISALNQCKNQIESLIEKIVKVFLQDGRLFYVGAGTSGRLGVLDASECPPTFSVKEEMVQGIIAGGERALKFAIEGAEDREEDGKKEITNKQISSKDIVVGIAASGKTPFVHGALQEAKKRYAQTALISCSKIEHSSYLDVLIIAAVGPEILSGSTRLKAGTVTKLILNMLSTISMIQIGKVYENLMIDVNPSNVKLKNRAIRIFNDITGNKNEEFAHLMIAKAKGNLKVAIVMTIKNVDYSQAYILLQEKQNILHKVLETHA